MIWSFLADKRCEITRDELGWHMLFGISDTRFENSFNKRCGAEYPARRADCEARSVALQLRDVLCRKLVEGGRVDQHEFFDALRSRRSEPERDVATDVHAHEDSTGNSERGHRRVEIFGLRRNSEIRIVWAVGFAVSEQIDCVRGMSGISDRRRNVPPEKTRS